MPPARRVRFIQEARADFDEAVGWYAQRDPEIAESFSRSVKRAVAMIADAPERWPVKDGTRRYILGRFPYTLAYHMEGALISIIAVAHHSRAPGAWSARR